MTGRRRFALAVATAALVSACGGGSSDTSDGEAAAAAEDTVSDGSSSTDGVSIGPDTGDHWHSPYAVYVCDQFLPPFDNPSDPEGIHSHADGIIHIHPFGDLATGENATLGLFFAAVEIQLSDSSIAALGGEARIDEGQDCGGEPTLLQVARWPIDGLDGEPEIITEGLADIVFEADLDSYTIAFVPEGAPLLPPPTVPNLASLTDVEPDELPDVSGIPEAASAVPRAAPPDPGATVTGPTACPDPDAQRTTQFSEPPPICLDPGVSYVAVFDTTEGVVRVELDTENTPATANNFAVLAGYGYYDGTALFRTDTSIDIIQGGSPTTNSPSDPGPGYTIADESGGFAYVPGDLAMARTAAPDSAGAQFFFSAGPDTSLLDEQGTYVVFGRVQEGLEILEEILGLHVDDPTSGLGGGPSREVIINSITIEEG